MTLICQAKCYDIDPICLATSAKALWLKCSICGKVNIRLRQVARGSIETPDGQIWSAIESAGEIVCGPGHPEPPKSEQVQPSLAELRAHYSR
jgi:hypothetical protein